MLIVQPKKFEAKGQSGGHWYTASGSPLHTQPDGKNTTLRHARKQDLYPSVTTLLGILDKPQLTKWKCDKCIEEAYYKRPLEDEDLQGYKNRIHHNLKGEQGEILDFGTRVHNQIEDYNNGIFNHENDPDVLPYVVKYIEWSKDRLVKVSAAEKVVVNHRYGYAGTVDLVGQTKYNKFPSVLIDFKTQNIKGNKANFYDTWALQLAAYRKCFKPMPACMSLVINSAKPEDPVEKIWTTEEMKDAWNVFKRALEIWQLQKKYKPTFGRLQPLDPNNLEGAAGE